MPTPEEEAAAAAEAAEAKRLADEAAAASAGSDDDDGEDGDDFDKPRAMSTIKTLRASEKALSKQLKDEKAARLKLEEASKTEAQKQTDELERLRKLESDVLTERKVTAARTAFTAEAQKAGALKPDALFRLADGLTYDDEGKPTNAKEVIRQLREDFPEMFNSSNGDGGAGKGKAPAPKSMDELIRSMRGR